MSKHTNNRKLPRTNAVFQKILDGSAFAPRQPAIHSLGDIKIEASFRPDQKGYKVALTKAGSLSTHEADTICSRIRLVFPDFTFPAAASSNMIEMLFEPILTCAGLQGTEGERFFLWIQVLENSTCACATETPPREERPNDILRHPTEESEFWNELLPALGINPFILLTLKANGGSISVFGNDEDGDHILTLRRDATNEHSKFVTDHIIEKLDPYTVETEEADDETELIIDFTLAQPLRDKYRERLSKTDNAIRESGAFTKHCSPGNGHEKFIAGLRGENPKLRNEEPRKGYTVMRDGIRPSKVIRNILTPITLPHRNKEQREHTTRYQSLSLAGLGASIFLWKKHRTQPIYTWPTAILKDWQIRRIVDYRHISSSFSRRLEYPTAREADRVRLNLLSKKQMFASMESFSAFSKERPDNSEPVLLEILAHLPRIYLDLGIARTGNLNKESSYNALQRAVEIQMLHTFLTKKDAPFPIMQHLPCSDGTSVLACEKNILALVQSIPDDFLAQKRKFLTGSLLKIKLFSLGLHSLFPSTEFNEIVSKTVDEPCSDIPLIERTKIGLIKMGLASGASAAIDKYIADPFNSTSARYLTTELQFDKSNFSETQVHNLIERLLSPDNTGSQVMAESKDPRTAAPTDIATQLTLTLLRTRPEHFSLAGLLETHKLYGRESEKIRALSLCRFLHHTHLKPESMPEQAAESEAVAKDILQYELKKALLAIALPDSAEDPIHKKMIWRFLLQKFEKNERTELTISDLTELAFILRRNLTPESRTAIIHHAMNKQSPLDIDIRFIAKHLQSEADSTLPKELKSSTDLKYDFLTDFFPEDFLTKYPASLTSRRAELLPFLTHKLPYLNSAVEEYNQRMLILTGKILFQYIKNLEQTALADLIIGYLENGVTGSETRIFKHFSYRGFQYWFQDPDLSLTTALKFLTLENAQFKVLAKNVHFLEFVLERFLHALRGQSDLHSLRTLPPRQLDNLAMNIQSSGEQPKTIIYSYLALIAPTQPSSVKMLLTFARSGDLVRSARGRKALCKLLEASSQPEQLKTAKKTIHSLFFNMSNTSDIEVNHVALLQTLISLDRHQFKKAARYLTTIGFGLYSHRLRRRKLAHTFLQAYTFIRNREPNHYRSTTRETDKRHKFLKAQEMLGAINVENGTFHYTERTTFTNEEGTLGMLTTILKRQDRGVQAKLRPQTLPTIEGS